MLADDEIIREFLIESNENLNRLDTEIVDLEQNPSEDLLASIFRTIHTIKGTCGFLGFETLEGLSHHAENILSQLRAGQRKVNANIVSLILESVDATRQILSHIEATGLEGDRTYPDLIFKLEQAAADTADTPSVSKIVAPEMPSLSPAIKEAKAILAKPVLLEPTKSAQTINPPDREKASIVADSSIRVDVSLLDKLMNLVGELVLARNQLLQFTDHGKDTGLNTASQRLNLITSELQESVIKTRMQPIGVIWNKLPRVVRDVAHSLGKQIDLEMEGAETELDKTIIEAIKDPLTHLVRNACDHGIEDPVTRSGKGKPAKGKLTLKAFHEGGQVNIEITDDGSGVEVEKVKRKAIEKGLIRPEQATAMNESQALGLLFLPGFSTASAITNVSGRGVGMDVVKSNVEKIGGVVDISTSPHKGTTVKLKIPLTLAIIPGLLVTSGGHRFVIPQISLLELIRLEGEALAKIELVHDTPVFRRRGRLLPIAYLNQLLKLPATSPQETRNIVVLQAEDRQFGLIVDGINDTQEIVVKPLGKQLKPLTCYSGSTIMGDGTVALILDVHGLGQLSGVLSHASEAQQESTKVAQTESEKQRLLLFSSGSFERLAVPLSLVARLEEIPLSSVERAAGRKVVQYRGSILPLIELSALLESDFVPPPEKNPTDPVQVVVFSNENHPVGLIVDHIIDIVDEAITMRGASASRPGILGSAVIGAKVADFLDVQNVLERTGERSLGAANLSRPIKVLLAEPSRFNRGLLRSQLEMSGHHVIEAASLSEACNRIEREPIELLVIGTDLLTMDPSGAESIRRIASAAKLPTLALGTTRAEIAAHQAAGLLFDEYQPRFEREAMLQSISRLSKIVHRRQEPSNSSFDFKEELQTA